jgi:hypothetical protein
MEIFYQIKDVKLLQDAEGQSVAVEFGDGRVRTFTGKQLYDASRFLGEASSEPRTAAQRRAEDMLAAARKKRR